MLTSFGVACGADSSVELFKNPANQTTHHPIVLAVIERNWRGVSGETVKWRRQLIVMIVIQRVVIELPKCPASDDLRVVDHVHRAGAGR